MIKHQSRWLLGLISLFVCDFSLAYEIDINAKRFRHISSVDGLSSNNITSILQDSRGYFWFGTENGLNQYDGYDFKIYRPDEKLKNSLSDASIFDLIEDSKGNLWIATANGLNHYDFTADQFHRYLYDKNNVNRYVIRTLLIDGDTLWLGGEGGLSQFNMSNGVLGNISSGYNIYNMVSDDDHGLWLATDKKLIRYDMMMGTSEVFEIPINGPIWTLFKDKNVLWLGTHDGVQLFNLATRQLLSDGNLLPGIAISDFAKDDHGNLWIGTYTKGLFQYSFVNETLKAIDSETKDPFFYSSSNVRELYFDKNKTLWIGGFEGVHYVDINNSLHLLRSGNKKLVNNTVLSVAMDTFDNIWVGTSKGGTVLRGQASKSYDLGYAVSIRVIGPDIWAVGNQGVFLYDAKQDRFDKVNDKIPDLMSLDIKLVYDIDKIERNIFILATTRGLILWDRKNAISSILKVDCENTKLCNRVMAFYTSDDITLVSTLHGLYQFDSKSRSIERYLKSPSSTILDGSRVYYTIADKHKNIWVATNSGLFKLRDGKILSRFTQDHGLSDSTVRSIAIINDRLWLSTDFGLDSFDIKDGSFNKIYLNDDQFNLEFMNNAVFTRDDNLLFFGGVNGVLYFDPGEYIETASLPKTRIADFRLFNQIQKTGSDILPQAVESTDQLILSYDQNMLTFEFSSMNYLNPDHLYAFQMEGVTGAGDKWLYTDAKNRRATFTPSPGHYMFRVKSGWDKNTWSDEVTELKVIILPPWWKTSYAYFVYMFLLILGVVSIIKARTLRLHKQAEILKLEVAERTNEIQDLLEKKNDLFANVSHELRTPLTLIIDPIKWLIKECKSPQQKKRLLLVKRNSQRLLHMVDQLLTIARTTAPIDTKPQAHDLSKVVNLLVDSMRDLVDKKKLILSLNCEDDILVAVRYEELETIVLNLLTNAIKYSDPGGLIRINLKKNKQQAQLIISDTGIGVKEEDYDLIFERFGRVNNEDNRNVPGTGIGLALVKEVLERHHGSIGLDSQVGKGSEFIVYLPLAVSCDAVALAELSLPSHSEAHYLQEKLIEVAQPLLDQQKILPVDQAALARLLIIEDTQDMREYLFTVLSEDYTCMTAIDAEQGLEQANKHLPDLIICDVMMPGKDGFELLQAIRDDEQTSHIPLILLTAKTEKESQLKGFDQLADDYITKPFDLELLHSRIVNLLAGRKLLREYYCRRYRQSEHPHANFQATLVKDKQLFLQKFHRLIEENYHRNDFTVDDMAAALHMSNRTLLQKLKSIIDQSPKEYLILFRLKAAAKLLLETTLSIGEIQGEIGFSGSSHFAYSFRSHFKVTPKEYRRRSCATD